MRTDDTYQGGKLIQRIAMDPATETVTTYELVDGELVQTAQRGMTAEELDAHYESQRQDPTEAVRLAARLSVQVKVTMDELDDATVAALAPLYDPWRPGLTVTAGDLYAWDGTIVECVQGHTTQADWTPDVTPALWKVHRTVTGDTPDEWVQPTGAQDAYNTGDRVTFEGAVYESLIDANTWSPAVYPAGWKVV